MRRSETSNVMKELNDECIKKYFVSFLRKLKIDDCFNLSTSSRLRRFWNSCTGSCILRPLFSLKTEKLCGISSQCNFYLPYIWNSFQCFELLTLIFHPGQYYVLRNTILNSNFLIQDAFLDISQSIALTQRKSFPLKHCVKYARMQVFSPGIFLYKVRIADSIVIREYKLGKTCILAYFTQWCWKEILD